MTKETKIIILGAGASIGSKRYPINSSHDELMTKMPSANNFFHDLFWANKTDTLPAGTLNFLDLTYEKLNELLTRAWRIDESEYDPDNWKNVNIEEVMTFFETGIKMYPNNSSYQKVFKIAQKNLLEFISLMLANRADGQHCEYLTRVFLKLKKNDSVISFNWDTIADQTLFHINSGQIKNYAHLLRDDNIERSFYRDKGLLLKLHGSLNWMTCSNKDCRYNKKVRPPFQEKKLKLLKVRDLYTCSCGDNHPKPLIVPPVSDKLIHKNSFLKTQWYLAQDKLLDANELIFIGYSFPPTDYYSEWLFRQISFIMNKQLPKITIVNPDYKKRDSSVKFRFNSIFKNCTIEHFDTLKDYVKK